MKKNTKIPDFIFSFLFIVFPAILIYLFLSPDFRKQHLASWILWLINITYLIFVICITYIFYKLNMVKINFINSNIALAICFITIFLTYPLKNSTTEIIIRIIIVLIMIFSIVPIMMISALLLKRKQNKNNKL